MSAADPESYIMEIIEKYRYASEGETPESYIDGARVAGAMHALLEDDTFFVFILALGLNVDDISPQRLVDSPELMNFLIDFRSGVYFTLDIVSMLADMQQLEDAEQRIAEEYVDTLRDRFRIGLVLEKEAVIDLAELEDLNR